MVLESFFGGITGSRMVILKGSKLVRSIFIIVVGAKHFAYNQNYIFCIVAFCAQII